VENQPTAHMVYLIW